MFRIIRKNTRNGSSYYVALPASMERGEQSTMVAQRLILIDPQGRYSTDLLSPLLDRIERALNAEKEEKNA